MNAYRVVGFCPARVILLLVFFFGCFLTLRWGGFSVVADYRRTPDQDLVTLKSLQKTPLDQWDPMLLPLVRQVLVPPSSRPYYLNNKCEHSHGQAQLIKRLFKGKVS